MFEKAKKFIEETYTVLDEVGKANPQGEGQQADLGVALILLKQGAVGELPKGCPPDYNMAALRHLIALENELRGHAVKL